jgi:hypothetical protein
MLRLKELPTQQIKTIKDLPVRGFGRILRSGFKDTVVFRIDATRVINLALKCIWDKTLLGQNVDDFPIEILEKGTTLVLDDNL